MEEKYDITLKGKIALASIKDDEVTKAYENLFLELDEEDKIDMMRILIRRATHKRIIEDMMKRREGL